MDQYETWYGCRPRTWPHCARCESSSPSAKGTHPNFWPMSVDGSRCLLAVGTEVGLGPGHIVLDADLSPEKRHKMGTHPKNIIEGGTASNFRLMSVVAKRLDGSRCHLVGLSQGNIVLDGIQPPSQKNGHTPTFGSYVYCDQINGRPSQLLLST